MINCSAYQLIVEMKKYLLIVFAILIFLGFTNQKPKILIIGDSISIGYTPFVKDKLKDIAEVRHNPGNAEHTGTGLAKLNGWIDDTKWDIIQFNWGLWDLCYRHRDSKNQGNRDKINGTQTFSLEMYEKNLTELVLRLKQTNAKLIFVTTSYVPDGESGRVVGDDLKFNEVAKKVMKQNGVLINNIYKASKKIHKKHSKALGDVHYTEEGYKLLAEEIVEFLQKEL